MVNLISKKLFLNRFYYKLRKFCFSLLNKFPELGVGQTNMQLKNRPCHKRENCTRYKVHQ